MIENTYKEKNKQQIKINVLFKKNLQRIKKNYKRDFMTLNVIGMRGINCTIFKYSN